MLDRLERLACGRARLVGGTLLGRHALQRLPRLRKGGARERLLRLVIRSGLRERRLEGIELVRIGRVALANLLGQPRLQCRVALGLPLAEGGDELWPREPP